MAYTPFKMRGPSLYTSPAKNDKKYLTSDNKVTTNKVSTKYERNKDGSVTQIKSDNENMKSYINEFDKTKTSKDGNTTSYAQRGNKSNTMSLSPVEEKNKKS